MEKLAETITGFIEDRAAADEGREYFRKPLVGFSRADDPLFDEVVKVVGPHHQLPRDFLPGAKSVISFFIPFQKAVVQANKGDGPVSLPWACSYVAANKFINGINQSLCELLTGQGWESVSVPATHTYDPETLKAGWSHRSAAFVAGLGRFGINRMLITKLGCAGRYGTVFTTAELPTAQRPTEELCLYYKSGSCRACLKACPASALEVDGFERFKCNDQLLANTDFFRAEGVAADVCGKCVTAGPCAYSEAV